MKTSAQYTRYTSKLFYSCRRKNYTLLERVAKNPGERRKLPGRYARVLIAPTIPTQPPMALILLNLRFTRSIYSIISYLQHAHMLNARAVAPVLHAAAPL
jgi:hypothetical protein